MEKRGSKVSQQDKLDKLLNESGMRVTVTGWKAELIKCEEEVNKLKAALKTATEALQTPEMDCGDNSCRYVFPENRGGMRTNGGCRCIDGKGRLILERHLHNQRQALEQIKEMGK